MTPLLLLVLASPFTSSPEIDVDAGDALREPWRAACEAVARELPGPGRQAKRAASPASGGGSEGFARAGPGVWRIRVRQASTIDEFVARTGRARFEAAALAGDTIWLQAAAVLDRFADLEPIRRHECVHARLRFLGLPPLPHVIEEAIALGISGQGVRLPPAAPLARDERAQAEAILTNPGDREIFENTLARAHATVWPKWRALARARRLSWLREIVFAKSAWVDLL